MKKRRDSSSTARVREALELYFSASESDELIQSLGKLQRKNELRTKTAEVRLIDEDRRR